MGSITYTQGENHILQTYFNGVSFTGPFYVGLGVGAKPTLESATLADIVEVTGQNYSRQPIQRDVAPGGWDVAGDIAYAASVQFFNSSATECWDPTDFAFLTLSPADQDPDDILIAAVDLTETLLVQPEQEIEVTFRFRQL